MHIKEHEFEAQVKKVLNKNPAMSLEFETVLFSKAEDLLATRRERRSSREAEVRQMDQARKNHLAVFQRTASGVLEFFAIHPNAPATAATFATLVLAFLALHISPDLTVKLSYSDLPSLPKNNDFSARYDALLLAERQAYEREVEDDHQKTSGGI